MTCQSFAVALNRKTVTPEACPDLGEPLSAQVVYPVYDTAGAIRSTVTIETRPKRFQTHRPHTDKIAQGPTEPAPTAAPIPDHIDPRYRLEPRFGLSDREIEVLRRVAEGHTNVEIAAALFISPHTVKSHVIHIFNKLGVNDRTQAAVLATRHGIL
ncbi:MAG: response regulator transcription factor [Desulfobacterales bacterium]|nr:response regulator transcription factor [Desulfobacterales bacterium]